MYEPALILHSILRLVAVALTLAVFVRALHGLLSGRLWEREDRRFGLALIIVVDLQLLVGLGLYLLWSPAAKNALQNMSAAMTDPELRRVAVEHPTMMLAAIALLHVGNALSKRVASDALRHRWMFVASGVALLLMAVGSPWPWHEHARPFVRLHGG